MSNNEVDMSGKAACVAWKHGNKLNLTALVGLINSAKLIGLMVTVVVGVEHLHFGPFYRLTTGVENSDPQEQRFAEVPLFPQSL